jgi:hypothetical protein
VHCGTQRCAASAQQGDRVRRIGLFACSDENDPVAKTFVSAFTQALADLGWTDGRNARMNVPAVHYRPDFVREGGLLSYGPDPIDNFRRAASYVDRILRGEKPAAQ